MERRQRKPTKSVYVIGPSVRIRLDSIWTDKLDLKAVDWKDDIV